MKINSGFLFFLLICLFWSPLLWAEEAGPGLEFNNTGGFKSEDVFAEHFDLTSTQAAESELSDRVDWKINQAHFKSWFRKKNHPVTAPNHPEIRFTIDYRPYIVIIKSREAVVEELLKATPIAFKGRKYFGKASWYIDYDLTPEEDSGLCQMKEFSVSTRCDVTLPRLLFGPSIDDDAALKVRLLAYVENLKKHELNHCRIALEHADKLHSALKKVNKQYCHDFYDEVERIYSVTIEECMRDQENFDGEGSARGEYQGLSVEWYLSGLPEMPNKDGESGGGAETGRPEKEDDGKADTAEKDEFSNYYKDKNGVWRNYK